jgi:nucleotide-binding universal stress UspA family protein
MFALERILFPVDFSERCRGASHYIDALAKRFDPRITMLHVLPPPHHEFSAMEVAGDVMSDFFATRSEYVRKELDSFLCPELRHWRTERILIEGDPAREIVHFAHDTPVDLIVMPSHGYGPFRRFILGSVTAKVLHDADCPVWTGVHMEQAPSPESIAFHEVLVALDLGPHAEKTLAWASRFAEAFHARLRIVHATPSIEGRVGEYFDPEWREHFASEAQERMAAVQAEIGAQNELILEPGDAPSVVCGVARTMRSDLLVIGRGSAAGIFGRLRANAYSIIRQSPCPVVSV